MRENVTPGIKSIGFDAVERTCMVVKSCWMTSFGVAGVPDDFENGNRNLFEYGVNS